MSADINQRMKFKNKYSKPEGYTKNKLEKEHLKDKLYLIRESQVIKAKVPLSEMFGYVTQLRTLTSGRATSTMEFSHYNEAPNNVAQDVISKAKGKAEKV